MAIIEYLKLKVRDGKVDVYEVEKSDSIGIETVETTSEERQKHKRHVNLICVTARTEESWSNDWKFTQTLTGRVIK